jgi:organic hydroperoxide reductase OsmC/OhrA
MMGTLAGVLAGKKIPTPEDRYWAEVEGDIENVNGVLKITKIRVTYRLRIPKDKSADARDALSVYLARCPAAQSVIGCIQIQDHLTIEEVEG